MGKGGGLTFFLLKPLHLCVCFLKLMGGSQEWMNWYTYIYIQYIYIYILDIRCHELPP